jgi:ATP-dependent phosphoenolpyruvate carboxykinase
MFNLKDVRPEVEEMGFENLGALYWNASTPQLYEEIVRRREGTISHLGPVVVRTGHHMGRQVYCERTVQYRQDMVGQRESRH